MQRQDIRFQETPDAKDPRGMSQFRWISFHHYWNSKTQENRFPEIPPEETQDSCGKTQEPEGLEEIPETNNPSNKDCI